MFWSISVLCFGLSGITLFQVSLGLLDISFYFMQIEWQGVCVYEWLCIDWVTGCVCIWVGVHRSVCVCVCACVCVCVCVCGCVCVYHDFELLRCCVQINFWLCFNVWDQVTILILLGWIKYWYTMLTSFLKDLHKNDRRIKHKWS